VPVVYVDLSEDEERLILATLDPLGALALGDKAKLGELLTLLGDQAALQSLRAAQASAPAIESIAPRPLAGETPAAAQGPADHLVEITCSAADLECFRPALDAWGRRPGVRIHIGRPGGMRHAQNVHDLQP